MHPIATIEKEPTAGKPGGYAGSLFWMAWSGFVNIANSVVVWICMARMRDVDEVGRFAMVMGLYALFFNVVSLGLMPYLINEISRRNVPGADNAEVRQFISSAQVFLLLSGILSAGIMTVCGFLMGDSASIHLSAAALSLAMVPSGLIVVSEAAAVSFGRTRLIAVVATVENILRTIVPVALIWQGYSLIVICLSFTAVKVVALAIYAAASGSQLTHFSFDRTEFRRIFTAFPTFAGITFFASLNWQAGLVLLGYLSIESESAKFGAASRFLIPVSILAASYAAVIQPAIAQHLERSVAALGAYLSKMVRVPLIAATVAALCAPLLAGEVLARLFGEAYRSASGTLDILALSVIPFCLVMVVARGLVAIRAQHVDLIANALGTVVCFSAGWLLVPRYGAAGAAGAQLAAFVTMAVVEIGYLSKKIANFNVWRIASFSSGGLLFIYLVLWNRSAF